MAKSGEEKLFSAADIAEALNDVAAPELVATLLTKYLEQQREEQYELERMERMIAIIDAYDEILLLESEGGCAVLPDPIYDAADRYLASMHKEESKDALDRKARLTSLYILAAFDKSRNTNEPIVEALKKLPHIEEIREELDRQGFVFKMRKGEDN